MTRFVIDLPIALRLARDRTRVPASHALLAPTLLRSQTLASLYQAVQAGALDRREASQQLDHLRRLRIRLLGDRVLQRVAWDLAEQLGWPDTTTAEYVALTRLQADALVTHDEALRRQLKGVVRVTNLLEVLDDA